MDPINSTNLLISIIGHSVSSWVWLWLNRWQVWTPPGAQWNASRNLAFWISFRVGLAGQVMNSDSDPWNKPWLPLHSFKDIYWVGHVVEKSQIANSAASRWMSWGFFAMMMMEKKIWCPVSNLKNREIFMMVLINSIKSDQYGLKMNNWNIIDWRHLHTIWGPFDWIPERIYSDIVWWKNGGWNSGGPFVRFSLMVNTKKKHIDHRP